MVHYRKHTLLQHGEAWVFHFPEPAPGEHEMSPEQRMDDAHSNIFGCWANPQGNTMRHHFRRDKEAPRTTRSRARQPPRPVSVRARQLANTGET